MTFRYCQQKSVFVNNSDSRAEIVLHLVIFSFCKIISFIGDTEAAVTVLQEYTVAAMLGEKNVHVMLDSCLQFSFSGDTCVIQGNIDSTQEY